MMNKKNKFEYKIEMLHYLLGMQIVEELLKGPDCIVKTREEMKESEKIKSLDKNNIK